MISALVSAYYAEQFLDRRLVNLEQEGVEAIVVCQTESAEEEIAKWHGTHIVITEDIPTIGKAWNLGIQVAHGEYLTTANSDDEFYHGGLQIMAGVMERYPDIGLIFSDVDISDETGVHRWRRVNESGGPVEDIAYKLSRGSFIGPMPLWRKALHSIHGMFDESMIVSCDYDFWLRLARNNVKFWYIPRSLGIYSKRDKSLEHRNEKAMRQERQLILERYGVL